MVRPPPAAVGETFTLQIRLGDDEIRAFARQLHDLNPLHHELAAARAAGYPGLIASGAHTGAIFMGMTATHFSAPSPAGEPRSVLGARPRVTPERPMLRATLFSKEFPCC